ncbi:RagB/SusD family nutrient uptake outer membrane protein, partial [Parabacteroides goldsteinii]
MKKIYAVIAASLLAFSGCNVLDTKDLSNYGPDVWNDSKLTSAFLTDIYGNVLNLTWPRDGGNSDECLGIMGKDAVQPNNSSFKFWPYTSIRNINTLLKNVDEGTLPESEKNLMKGQAYFMRAFQYFKMV